MIAYSLLGTPAYDGLRYYDLGGFGGTLPGNGDGIQQTVATTALSTYTLQFGLSSENVSGNETLNVLFNGVIANSYALGVDGSGGFHKPFATQILSYTATTNLTTLAFTVTGTTLGTNDPMIDGVSFSPSGTATVPEPSAVLLLLTVIAIVGLSFWRKPRWSR